VPLTGILDLVAKFKLGGSVNYEQNDRKSKTKRSKVAATTTYGSWYLFNNKKNQSSKDHLDALSFKKARSSCV
jgi:hypothetical protein